MKPTPLLGSFDHDRADFEPYGLTCVRWHPESMDRADRHNEIEVNYLWEGTVTYLVSGTRRVLRPGRLIVFWAGVPHQIYGKPRLREYYVVTVPLARFLEWNLPPPFVQAVLAGQLIETPVPPGQRRSEMGRFAQWEKDLALGGLDERRIVLMELQARLSRVALRTVQRKAQTPLTGPAPTRVERLAQLLAQRHTEALKVTDLAAAIGLHPKYAMHLFKRVFGTTLRRHLERQRLATARTLLVTTSSPVLRVAMDAGFGSLSRFNEVFRRETGVSPRTYRERNGAEPSPAPVRRRGQRVEKRNSVAVR
jgi:AraC family transcriptional regulator, melibiose operon regulatory protein